MTRLCAWCFVILVEADSTSRVRKDHDGDEVDAVAILALDYSNMHSVKTLAVALLAAQSAWGALFPRSGPVKDLQAKDFKKELGDGVSCPVPVNGLHALMTL